jgi:hypothetical protein
VIRFHSEAQTLFVFRGFFLPRSGIQFGCVMLVAALLATSAQSQTAGQQQAIPTREPAIVTSVRVVQDRGVPAVEIITSHPVLPTIQMLDSPPRLVIDLANARIGLTRKRTPVLQENMLTLRAEQFQNEPPITRIVLDLLVTYGYTWDVSGDTLMVRLKPAEDPNAASKKSPRQPPQVLSLAPAATPAVVPVTSGLGDVVMAGKQFAAGSSLTAESDTAVLRLARGGEVRVCPGTTVSVTPSKKTSDLMLGMSTGGLETHYSLAASADTVLTPDFRILFAGPGEFHFAVSADSHGTTCVRGLKGNTSSAIVSELIGDRIYQVKPNEQAVFRLGRIDKVDTEVPLECGCPPPVPVMRTDASPTTLVPDSGLPANLTLADSGASSKSAAKAEGGAPQVLSSGPETQPLPASKPDDVHIQVDAPLVFHGKKDSAAQPAPTDEAATLPAKESSAPPAQVEAQVQPPPAAAPAVQAKPEHRSVLRRIGRFFSAIWR